MRVLLFGSGTLGDSAPLLALALSLSARGHQTTVAAGASIAPYAERAGLTFEAVGTDPRYFLRDKGGLLNGAPTPRSLKIAVQSMRDDLNLQLEQLYALAQHHDILVGTTTCFGAPSAAAAARIPYQHVALSPQSLPKKRDQTGPLDVAPFWPLLQPLLRSPAAASFYAGFSWLMLQRALNFALREHLDNWRQQHHLPPLLLADAGASIDVAEHLVTGKPDAIHAPHRPWLAVDLAVLQALQLEPQALTEQADVVGAWPMPPAALTAITAVAGAASQKPHHALHTFLSMSKDNALPTLYAGFGSMADTQPAQTEQMLVDLAKRSKCNLLVTRNWSRPDGAARDDMLIHAGQSHILFTDEIDHQTVLPHMHAAIYHAAAGTLAAVARAGCVHIPIPHVADQLVWAERLYQAGIAASPIAKKNLTIPLLLDAIKQALAPERIHKAKELARALAQMPPEKALADVVTRLEARCHMHHHTPTASV